MDFGALRLGGLGDTGGFGGDVTHSASDPESRVIEEEPQFLICIYIPSVLDLFLSRFGFSSNTALTYE